MPPMPIRMSSRPSFLRVSALATLSVFVAACSAGTVRPSSDPAEAKTPTAGIYVAGRAPRPTDVTAPGIAFAKGNLAFSVGNHHISISADNWNTIVGTSIVPHSVGSMIDPQFHATDVTRNRFQYLADLIAQYNLPNFEPIGIAEGIGSGQFIEYSALYNSTDRVSALSGLTVTVTLDPSGVVLAKQTFYSTAGTALVIPARTIYFARLSFAQFKSVPNNPGNSYTYSIDFHFAHFAPCQGQVCSNS